MYIVINELEKDVLKEIINISLARAADSFAFFSNKAVLLTVPEIKIIEPQVLPDVIKEFEEQYQIIRSEINGDLSGKIYLLFAQEQIVSLLTICQGEFSGQEYKTKLAEETLLLTISSIITKALSDELNHLLEVKVHAEKSEALFNSEKLPIKYILHDLPARQPVLIAIKTQFKKMVNSVELPLVIVLQASSISTLLGIIRHNNLYEFKLLQDND